MRPLPHPTACKAKMQRFAAEKKNMRRVLPTGKVCAIIVMLSRRCDGMADVTDSKSVGGDTVWVQVPPPAPHSDLVLKRMRSLFCLEKCSYMRQKNADSCESALLANPVDFDTRDGCTWLGAGMGAMHLFFTDQTDPSDTRIPPPPCVHRG